MGIFQNAMILSIPCTRPFHGSGIFSTSDFSSDVLLLSKVEICEIFRSESGADPLPKLCDLSEPIRGLESQNGSAPNLLPRADPLPKVM